MHSESPATSRMKIKLMKSIGKTSRTPPNFKCSGSVQALKTSSLEKLRILVLTITQSGETSSSLDDILEVNKK